MADGVSMDFSEVHRMYANLGRASSSMIVEARKVVAKGALNIKTDARKRISDHPSWARLEQTLNYDQAGLIADIGYDDRGQGELAGIAEFGSARHAPHPALFPAAKDEAPRFAEAIADVAAGLIIEAVGGPAQRSEYVTKAGRSIMATDAQIAHWTRG